MSAAMAKLKLTEVLDDKPVKLTIEFLASVHRDLIAYAEVLGRPQAKRSSRKNSSCRC
jgi:hypothetical protein